MLLLALGGTTEYVEPGEDVEAALAALARKIRHSVLVDLAMADAPVRLFDVSRPLSAPVTSSESLRAIVYGSRNRFTDCTSSSSRITP